MEMSHTVESWRRACSGAMEWSCSAVMGWSSGVMELESWSRVME